MKLFPLRLALVFSMLGLAAWPAFADPAFRTDGGNEKLPWYELKAGELPPEGSAHYIAGELIWLDHINRAGALRLDRTDAIRRSDWDHSMPFTILPYGSLSFHGAPAELRDIPIGTHLHGYFYWEAKGGGEQKGAFTKALRLEDDFSYLSRLQRTWKVEAVDSEKETATMTGGWAAEGAKPTVFQVTATTRVWKGRSIGSLSDLAAGQTVLLNLTVCTLKGPGRCTDLWLDPESRETAAALQVEVHRQFEREHGVAGFVQDVDNQQGTVTATIFSGVDPKLLEDFQVKEGLSIVVADETLRSYDQNSDRIRGDVLEMQTSPPSPGKSGLVIKFKPVALLEGFRPKRIVRLFAGKWKVDDLPKEERLYQ